VKRTRFNMTAYSRAERRSTRERGLPQNKGAKTARIDLGLALLAVAAKPGSELTHQDIAAWCGCTRDAIYLIEKSVLRKLANRLKFGRLCELGREVAA